ncbi:MAG: APC family permease [Solirubrobacteraceae bacterium]
MSITAARRSTGAARESTPRLRPHALGFPPLLAQSVALISPTMTAVLIIALAYGDAGNGTWAAYLFGTVMLLFVVLGLNQFARRSATAGSMYAYTARGLGPSAGVLSGWALVWSYWGIATAGLAGFAIFAQEFLSGIGVHTTVSPFLLFAISGAVCLTVAWKDIRISSLLTLVLEGLSVACILALAFVVLFKQGVSVDTAQVKLHGVTLKGMDFAIVICIFSLVGFESATTLGSEAKNPLRNVPRAVIWSLLITGAFMVFMSYVEVFATHHMGVSLGSLTTPLTNIASAYNVPFFHVPVALGAMVSFFSLSLSCLNAGARIIFPLSGHGFLPERAHAVHHRNMTPHIALASYGALILGVAMILHATGTSPTTLFDDAGTMAAFGFLSAYFLITIAAPFYLRKLGELRARHIAVAVAAFLCLMVPTVGSFYPAPPYPVNLFPYIFLAFMLIGGARLYQMHRAQPQALAGIQRDLEEALAASAHEIAVSEEEHQGVHLPGERLGPAPAVAPTGVGMVSARTRVV